MIHSDTLAETAYVTRTLPQTQAKPIRRMMAVLTAAATALSLMVATAMPAHADKRSDDLAKAIVAAIAIGAIINSADKGRADPETRTPLFQQLKDKRHARVPEVCAIEIQGARRDVVFYPERCLRREGFDYRLPRGCATDIRFRGRQDRAYSAQCLRDAGFRVGGREDRRDDRWDRRDDRGHGGHGRGRDRYDY